MLGDGAPWIWNIATELFPEAIQTVDRYHVHERLSEAAKILYGAQPDQADRWRHERCQELRAGDLQPVLTALGEHPSVKEARDCREYIRTNRHRIRYAQFHAAGLCTSSAAVESGCMRAIDLRLKQGGMFWTVPGPTAS